MRNRGQPRLLGEQFLAEGVVQDLGAGPQFLDDLLEELGGQLAVGLGFEERLDLNVVDDDSHLAALLAEDPADGDVLFTRAAAEPEQTLAHDLIQELGLLLEQPQDFGAEPRLQDRLRKELVGQAAILHQIADVGTGKISERRLDGDGTGAPPLIDRFRQL